MLPTPVCEGGLDVSELVRAVDEPAHFGDLEHGWQWFGHDVRCFDRFDRFDSFSEMAQIRNEG